MKTVATIFAILLLTACSPPSVPDVTYFRLPPPTPLPKAGKPLSALPIEVAVFSGDGIYAEQALIYAITPEANSLRAYHYQVWSDPPSRALQARLTTMLRDSGISSLVTDRLPASDQALRVRGSILRYERVKRDSGYVVEVAFGMRVEQDNGEPVIEQSYAAEVPAVDPSIAASAQAFGVAVDKAFAKFYTDLAALGSQAHAG